MKTLLRYLAPYRLRMAVGLTIKTSATLAELMLPYILSYILKEVVAAQDISRILLWGGAMILFAALACIGNVIANRMAAHVSADFAREMRRDLFDSTLRLSAAQTDKFTIPSLESRITSDTYNAHSFINVMQRMGVRAPILLIGGMAITLMMDAYLALAMLAALPLIFITVYFISRKGVPLYSRVQQAVDRMIRVVREDIQGIRVIKALSKTDYEHRRYDAANTELVRRDTHAGMIMGTVNPIMTLLMNGGIVAVVALAASRVSRGQSDPETVIAFMQYFTLISMAMMSVTRIFVMYTKCAASARRIAEVLEAPEDLPVHAADNYPADTSDAHIRFDRVSFSYNGKRQNVEDVSFSLPRGGRLGIIGATGCGKTTLVKLLLRFYDVEQGAVYIDGRDVRTIDKAALYATFGTAMQQDFLYDDTIEENIRFGRDIDSADVVRAARIAQADGFITAFADGYAHRLAAGGTNVSGGQKQRLLIARAIAGRPAILILDDSSSALDYKTDAALRNALAESMADTTVVTVAQRVSTIKDCDRILVLEEGRVIGDGTHDELMESCPTYREISDSQMGGAFVE